MSLKTAFVSALLTLFAFCGSASASSSFGFYRISSEAPIDISSQLLVDVSEITEGVLFTFTNSAEVSSSITDIYFDQGTTGLFSNISLFGDSGDGVSFDNQATPANLPGGNAIGFTADFSGDSNSPKVSANGINSSSEWVSFLGTLTSGQTYNSVISSFLAGDFRIGLHVQAISGDYSDSFVSPVPLPAAVWVFGSALLGFIMISNRHRV